jgi:large subunit ribosomal protein L25
MAHELNLRAEPRTTVGKRLGALRRAGYVPANVYGPAMTSIPIQVDLKAFQSISRQATPTTRINLTIGSEPRPQTVYLQHVQWQFTRNEPFHLDFYAVNLQRRMRSTVQLAFRGESPAAKAADVMLLQPVSQVHVEALPEDMPESIVVDLSKLIEAGQSIYARDLNLPAGVTLLDAPDELIARAQTVRGAVEAAPAEEAPPPTPTEVPGEQAKATAT